jgi:hypothetical protein
VAWGAEVIVFIRLSSILGDGTKVIASGPAASPFILSSP